METRLLVSFGTDRNCLEKADAMARFSGTAPITETSGKMRKVRRRYARLMFIYQTVVEYAKCTLNFFPWVLCYYQHQCARRNGHNTVRKLAIRWQRIVWRCWEEGTRYDEAKYLQCILK